MASGFVALSGWMVPVMRAMEARGLCLNTCLNACKIPNLANINGESMLAMDSFKKVIAFCNKELNSEHFSLDIAAHFQPSVFHALGYAMLSSATLSDALRLIARYKRVVSNACLVLIEEKESTTEFQIEPVIDYKTQQHCLNQSLLEVFFGSIVQLTRLTHGSALNPISVNFSRALPAERIPALEQFFNCPIKFSAPADALVFATDALGLPLFSHSSSLLSAHENRLNQLLAALQSDDIVLQVRQFIIQSISEGEIHQDQVANQLGMSTRNFQRKLSHQGTSFREILAITRQEITINHMKNPQLALGEISFLVGFSSISNFNRAFKRWFGITPGAYRKGLTS